METTTLLSRSLLAPCLAFFTVASPAVSDDWQVDRLLHPTEAQLAAEARGSVVIYEGLEAGQVAHAMDEHFERIQNMMFTRIHHLPPTGAGGEVEIEDDGCSD